MSIGRAVPEDIATVETTPHSHPPLCTLYPFAPSSWHELALANEPTVGRGLWGLAVALRHCGVVLLPTVVLFSFFLDLIVPEPKRL